MPGIGASGFFVCRRGDTPSVFCRSSTVNGRMGAYGVHSPVYDKSRHAYILVQDFRLFSAMPKSILFEIYITYIFYS